MSEQQNAPAVTAGAVRKENSAGTSFPIASSVGRGTNDVPPVDYRQATAVWARAQIRAFAGTGPIPEYGTAEWLRLPDRDPRRYAAIVAAAEQARTPRSPASRAEQRRTPPPRPRPLQATTGWPPIALPGCPGVYLTSEEAA